METKPTSHIVAGTIIAVVGVVFFLVYHFLGLSFERNFWSWIPSLITTGLIIFFVMQYGKANNHHLTFGQLFGYGFKMTIIFTLIMTLFMAIVVYFFPDFKEKSLEAMYNQMDKQGNISEEQRDTVQSMTEKFFNISVIGGSLFINLLIGTVASLVAAAVTKKIPHTPFDNKA